MYIRMKMKAAEEIGIQAKHVVLPHSTNQAEVKLPHKLNRLQMFTKCIFNVNFSC